MTIFKNLELSCVPVIAPLSIYLEELKAKTQILTSIFIESLFKIAERWKQHKCPSSDEWINQIWYIHMVECLLSLKKEGNSDMCYNMNES